MLVQVYSLCTNCYCWNCRNSWCWNFLVQRSCYWRSFKYYCSCQALGFRYQHLEVGIVTGRFFAGEQITGAKSGAAYDIHYVGSASTTLTDKYQQNDELESEADSILDFTNLIPLVHINVSNYFYHEIIRKTIIGFGTLLMRSISNIRIKMERSSMIKGLLLAYGPAQKFLARIEQQSNLNKRQFRSHFQECLLR